MAILVFICGLVIGSFLNVCIYRIPRKESIILPRSHCVWCKRIIPWYDNIPLLSFLLLGGKCRFCKRRISFSYFVVELITALFSLFMYNHFGFSLRFIIFTTLGYSLIVASFIDLDFQEIPDEITISGMIAGVLLGVFIPDIFSRASRLSGFFYSISGVLVGGGVTYLTGIFGKLLFKKEAMGGGDIKLMAMLGAFLSWRLVLLVFFIAPFFGSIMGIIYKLRHKKDIIPYGPHLSLAAIIVLVWGEKILNWLFLV